MDEFDQGTSWGSPPLPLRHINSPPVRAFGVGVGFEIEDESSEIPSLRPYVSIDSGRGIGEGFEQKTSCNSSPMPYRVEEGVCFGRA